MSLFVTIPIHVSADHSALMVYVTSKEEWGYEADRQIGNVNMEGHTTGYK